LLEDEDPMSLSTPTRKKSRVGNPGARHGAPDILLRADVAAEIEKPALEQAFFRSFSLLSPVYQAGAEEMDKDLQGV
jgi:hypothetical protein